MTIETQKEEFDSLFNLIKAYNNLPAIVDDDYPEQRHYYESKLRVFIEALTANGRFAKEINLYELHQKMTAHLFPAYSNTDERFLALALCGEAGELANMIKKRWRDNADLTEEIRDEIADIRVYLELLARCFAIEGPRLADRVQTKLARVVEKHKARLL